MDGKGDVLREKDILLTRIDTKEEVLKILTLNVWGLPFPIAKDTTLRIEAIGRFLLQNCNDVVCLQELWKYGDYLKLKEKLKNVLPYSEYYLSGVFGSGLCIFSKWPITKTYYLPWCVNGYFHMIHHGDWFGGKGVAFAQINFYGLKINIYNTHLIAKYAERDCYAVHRLIQAFDTGMFINLTTHEADLTIVCGDLNSSPNNICFKLIKSIGNLKDTFNEYVEHIDIEQKEFGTNQVPCNCYTPKQNYDFKKPYEERNPFGDRIDYILFKGGHKNSVKVEDYSLPLFSRIPGTDISYSDHEAVESKLKLIWPSYYGQENSDYDTNLLREAIMFCEIGEKKVNASCNKYLGFVLFFFLLMLAFNSVPSIIFLSTPCIVYCLIMGTIWGKIEMNAIRAAKARILKIVEQQDNIPCLYNGH